MSRGACFVLVFARFHVFSDLREVRLRTRFFTINTCFSMYILTYSSNVARIFEMWHVCDVFEFLRELGLVFCGCFVNAVRICVLV